MEANLVICVGKRRLEKLADWKSMSDEELNAMLWGAMDSMEPDEQVAPWRKAISYLFCGMVLNVFVGQVGLLITAYLYLLKHFWKITYIHQDRWLQYPTLTAKEKGLQGDVMVTGPFIGLQGVVQFDQN